MQMAGFFVSVGAMKIFAKFLDDSQFYETFDEFVKDLKS